MFEWQILFFRVRGYCLVLTKIKAMKSLPVLVFQRVLSVQFFWDIQRKANYPRAIQEFEIPHQTFVMMAQNIVRCNLNAGVFRNYSSI